MMSKNVPPRNFRLCVKNDGYPASLEVRKVYESLPDSVAGSRGLVRIVDESGEDYLYPSDYFIPVKLPKAATVLFAASS